MRLLYILFFFLSALLPFSSYAQIPPVEFIENKGQWSDWFQYKAATQGGEVMLEKDGFRYILCDAQNVNRIDSFHVGLLKQAPTMYFHVYKVSFLGAKNPQVEGLKQQKTYYNYFIGNNPDKWKSNIHPYLAVNYNKLYDGIDMHVSSERGSLVYEFIVQPDASTDQIRLNFDGPEKMSIKKGDLIINTSVGQVMEMKPYCYQYNGDTRVVVACDYQLKNNVVSFDFPDGYDHSKVLVIDPTIVFCSFTGSTADNWGFTATYDNQGNFYAGGLVNALTAGTSFPVSPGAFQSTFGGGTGATAITYAADIGIMKFTPDGVSRIYATYIGGNGNERPHSMIVDTGDNLIIAGRTHSNNYPVTAGAFQTTNAGGWDMVVTKLNAGGTALIGSTYIGGSADDGVNFDSTESGFGHLKYNYGDDARSEVQVDRLGNIYVTGSTESTNFPTTASAISTTLSGLQDGVVFKFNNNLTSLIWSTYLSGTGDDAGYVLAFTNDQTSLYVAGGTNSANFPVTTGTLHSTYIGDTADGFVLKFQNSPPYNIQAGTFVGTTNFDQVYGIQVDNNDDVWVMGLSLGGLFPVSTGVYSNSNSCQFVMKMDNNLTSNLLSTVYGSGDPAHTNISPVAFLVDTCENVYISGWGGGLGYAPAHSGFCTGMPVTSDAHMSSTDGSDFYFIVFAPGLATLRYATFYGRNTGSNIWEGEHVDGGTSRFDKHGIIYQAICANCGGTSSVPFPTTLGSWAPVDGCSFNCNEAALKIAFNIGPVTLHITASPSTVGCAPLTINFNNTSLNTISYLWNFGDGSANDTSFAPTHTFTAAGTFTVTVSGANTNACFRTEDTFRLFIVVDTDAITPNFNYTLNDSCGPFTVTFNNTSVNGVLADTALTTYSWSFGDGTTFNGKNPPIHTYADTGTYVVNLIMTDDSACVSPKTVTKTIHIRNYLVSAHFTIPDSICLGTSITPVVTTTNATTNLWSFGNGYTSNAMPPTYTYDSAGTYTVTLIVTNPSACNFGDTISAHIKVIAAPTAAFIFSPVMVKPNDSITYTNESINSVRYLWDFGDNTTGTEVNPVHMFKNTGTFRTCLTAYNSNNCPSKVCKQVQADIEPLVGLPTGFSPNGDGENDILFVRGAAIATLDLKIYNRWGQLVFETTTMEKGWDGTFNGQPQPIDAYAYVLNVIFINGTSKSFKGNVTLLR